MTNKPIELKDKTDGSILLPKTSTKLVYNDEGKSIDNITEEIKTNIDELDTKVGDKKVATPAHYELSTDSTGLDVVADDKVDFDELTEVKVTDANVNNDNTPFVVGDKVNFVAEVVTKNASGVFQYVDQRVLEVQMGGQIDLSDYQEKVDNNLTTDDKNLVNVINALADDSHYHEAFTDAEIEAMFDGTSEELQYYKSLIQDSTVSTNRLFSSQETVNRITQALLDSQKYANDLVGGLSMVKAKKVETKPDTGVELTIYLVGTEGNYHQWMFIEGAWADLGSTNVTLDGYVTEEKLTEELAKKADDDKVLKLDKITTTMSGTPSNDNVLSELAVKNLLDEKADSTSIPTKTSELANDSGFLTEHQDLSEYAKTTDLPTIATTINASSTNDTTTGTKAVYDELAKKLNKGTRLELNKLSNNDKLVISEWIDSTNSKTYSALGISNDDGSIKIKLQFNEDDGVINIFKKDSTTNNTWKWLYRYVTSDCVERSNGEWTALQNNLSDGTTSYRLQLERSGGLSIYETLDKWATINSYKSVCTTKVADVPVTNINIPTDMFNSYNANSYIKYEVKNGIAYFYIGIRDAGFKSTGVSFNINVPKCSTKLEHIIISENRESNISVIIQDRDMQLWCLGNTNATNFLVSFSYPVAES